MAIVLAVLYFALIELVLLDSQRELEEARRFRARIVAEALAENGAERAALQMVTSPKQLPVTEETEQGTFTGTLKLTGTEFVLTGTGTTSGITQSTANVELHGHVDGSQVWINYSMYP